MAHEHFVRLVSMKTLRLLVLFAVVGCAGASTTTTPVPAQLPALPAALVTAYGPIPVVLVDSLVDPATGGELAGAFSPNRFTIYVNRQVTDRRMQWAIAFHEQCHAELQTSGLHYLIAPQVAQAVCDLWALRELRRLLKRE